MISEQPTPVTTWPSDHVAQAPAHSATRPPGHVEGLLLVDKPRGMTSHDVVALVRRKLGITRIGHTGTLDPMAEGLLILLIGRATAHQQAFQGHDKSYEAVVSLGVQTDTGDADGRPVRRAPVPPFDRAHVARLLSSMEGQQTQTPPAYSAVKVRGRPAYWWARREQPVTLSARSVHIARLTLMDCAPQALTVHVTCSAGTYIRALAETIAERLGTVGHLTSLRRTRIDAWSLDAAKSLSWIRAASSNEIIQELRATSHH